MTYKTLSAQKRTQTGRKVKLLRKKGTLPANIYGKKIKSLSLQIDQKQFQDLYEEVGETGLLEIEVGTKKNPVLIHNVQLDPVSGQPLHVDFFQVDLKEKIQGSIPVELVGTAPAQQTGVGTLVHQTNEIEVEALPADLPEKFELDVTKLEEVDQAILVKDIQFDKSKITILTDPEQVVAKIAALEKIEEPTVEATAEEQQEEASSETPTEEKQEAPQEEAPKA